MRALTPTLLLFSSALAAVHNRETKKDASVLILGGGVTGVIAARTLHERGHDNFIVLDAREELGGKDADGNYRHSWTELYR